VPRNAAWLRFFAVDKPREAEIREKLAGAGIPLTSPENSATQPYGIVCFGALDDGLFHILHPYSCLPQQPVLALSASASAADAGVTWRLLHAGASDVVVWNERTAPPQIRARLDRWFRVEELTAAATSRQSLVGQSVGWLSLVRKIVEAARFSTVPVLITGESGTGKELLARLIHTVGEDDGSRPSADLVTVDCSTIVPELSGSELFGHERGAFTGAHQLREGALALADGATLFLDEVGELPLPLQAQLLRAIQEKTYKRVGGNVWLKTDFRLVCATNRDLDELVRRGQFRLDLYHRIAAWVFRTPPLQERRDDIVPLAQHFLSKIFPEDTPELDPAVRDYLLHRTYEGNIRELGQLIQRMAHRHAGPGPIRAGDVPEEDRPPEGDVPRVWPDGQLDRALGDAIASGASLREISAATTQAAIRIAVQSEQGNRQRAAKRLGVTDRALQMRRARGTLSD
jgi:transcriptional regulator with GAF, ATPase, and Fis domain